MWRTPEADAVASLVSLRNPVVSTQPSLSASLRNSCLSGICALSLFVTVVYASASEPDLSQSSSNAESVSPSWGPIALVRLLLDLSFVAYLTHSLYGYTQKKQSPSASHSPQVGTPQTPTFPSNSKRSNNKSTNNSNSNNSKNSNSKNINSKNINKSMSSRGTSPSNQSSPPAPAASATSSGGLVVERIDAKIMDIQSQLAELHALVADVDQPSDSLRDLLDRFVDGLEDPVLQINAYASQVTGPPHNTVALEQARHDKEQEYAAAARQQHKQHLQKHQQQPSEAETTLVSSSAADLLASLNAGVSAAHSGDTTQPADATLSAAADDLLASLNAGMSIQEGEDDQRSDSAGVSSAADDLLASLNAGMGAQQPPSDENVSSDDESEGGGLSIADQLLASLNANASSLEDYASQQAPAQQQEDGEEDPEQVDTPIGSKKSQAEQEAEWLAMAKAKKSRGKKNYTDVKFGRGGRRNKKKGKKKPERVSAKVSLEDLEAFADADQAAAPVTSADPAAEDASAAERNALADLLSALDTAPANSNETAPEVDTGSALADLLSALDAPAATVESADETAATEPVFNAPPKRQKPPSSAYNPFGDLFGGGGNADGAEAAATVAAERPEREPLQPRHYKLGDALVRDLAAKDDINKSGLRRAKKRPMNWGSKKKKRTLEMEDTNFLAYPFGKDDGVALFGVFDGHVGKYCAQAARERFPAQMQKALADMDLNKCTDLSDVVREVFAATDKDLLEFEYEGCTATGVVIWRSGEDRYLQCGNVGDSHAFLYRNGKALCLTQNHNVKDPEERERMRAAGFQVNEGQTRINGLAVSRALGDHFVKQNDMGMIGDAYVHPVVKLEDTDTLLLVCSDGVWDVISGQEACELVQYEKSAEAMASKLLRHSVRSVGCNDNVTVQVGIL
mmetsp:Transcript_2250/g.7129  ORF Transcript_2250/g.7129 Transcript_2250/m.7129 type:complete len:911 (+) Transcript_2250:406-3138(+)